MVLVQLLLNIISYFDSYKLSYGTHALITHSEQHLRRNWDEAPRSVIDEVKTKMINVLVNYCAKNLRPFAIAHGNLKSFFISISCTLYGAIVNIKISIDEGLHDLIRECIEMGSVYGTTLPTKCIVPHPNTVSRSVQNIAAEKRAEMKTFIMKNYNQGVISFISRASAR